MDRRVFLRDLAGVCAVGAAASNGGWSSNAPGAPEDITAAHIPRWRGFNLQAKFGWPEHPYDGPAFDEFDFATMAEWGFDFARFPLSYWTWGSRDD